MRDGARWIHCVDLDGSRDGAPANRDVVRRIAAVAAGAGVRLQQLGRDPLPGGGAQAALEAGASRVVLGTAAVERPALVGELVSALGAEAVVVALDGRGAWSPPGAGRPPPAAHGRSGARAGRPGRAALHLHGHHPGQHLTEPNFEELAALAGAVPAAVIASGGVTTAAQVARLAAIPLEGAIIGSALYAGRITLPEALAATAPAA